MGKLSVPTGNLGSTYFTYQTSPGLNTIHHLRLVSNDQIELREGATIGELNGESRVEIFTLDPGAFCTTFDQTDMPGMKYHTNDHLGNLRVTYRRVGASLPVDATYEYSPYGRVVQTYQAAGRDRYLSTGHEREEATNYDYRLARLYDAELGRFLSVDPLADHPRQIGNSTYSAMWNNPIRYNDPDGRCPKCPDKTYLPIADHVYGAQVGDMTSNGWEVIGVDSKESGFKGALYRGSYDNKTEYIYATAGTQDIRKDGVADMKQVFGTSIQYSESVEIANRLSKSGAYTGVSYTGHSLGGGLASANALATEGKAVTFNAAGLSRSTKSNLGLTGNNADITAYIVSGEALDYFQRNVGLRAEGNHLILLPSVGKNAIDKHMMNNVQSAFDIWQIIINDPNIRTFNVNK